MDRDIDTMMSRTTLRPLPRGAISPTRALVVGVILNILGFAILSIGANVQSGVLAVIASLFYILVYTAWLKRSTSQNIVIGGAAGAMPPLVAAAAVTGGVPMAAVYLFLIIFFWTPPHFWALALLIQDDYARAKVPMLPVVKGERTTYWNIFIYTIVLGIVNILFVITSEIGLIYLIVCTGLSLMFIYLAGRLLREANRRAASVLYKYSLLYLSVLFLAVIIDRGLTF
jgi:protoheme IX farnesyltransferase